MINAQSFIQALNLQVLSPSTQKEWDIHAAEFNRPGLQFVGFYEHFPHDWPQVVGLTEMSYLESLTDDVRRKRLEAFFSYHVPCMVICRGMLPSHDMMELAAKYDTAMLRTPQVTTRFIANAMNYLNRCLAPRATLHGVLVDVYGMGVLITGESGVGKSEAALELVRRGHQLVADDVVDICKRIVFLLQLGFEVHSCRWTLDQEYLDEMMTDPNEDGVLGEREFIDLWAGYKHIGEFPAETDDE